nr:molybdopterin cofactor-binding domain-containing protein [uncultured Allomuricauda sp.]
MKRRFFIQTVSLGSSGFALGAAVPFLGSNDSLGKKVVFEPNLLMSLGEDGIVRFKYTRHEMGQGSFTGLAMIFAEELGADWEKIQVSQADYDEKYGNRLYGNTGGSGTVRRMWEPLRELAATARTMLISAAAEKMNVPTEECFANNGLVIHKPSKQRVPFGELASLASHQEVPKTVTFRDVADYNIIGTPKKNLNQDKILDGKLQYSMDVVVDNMVYACIVRAPIMGLDVISFNAEEVKNIEGVVDVLQVSNRLKEVDESDTKTSMRNGVAVIAKDTWTAFEAAEKLQVEWTDSPLENGNMESIENDLAMAKGNSATYTIFETGDVVDEFKNTTSTFSRTYRNPFQAHALMEPMCATADYKKDRCEVWSSTQHPNRILQRTGKVVDRPISFFLLHNLPCGGSFGRRFYDDFITEAVVLSKMLKRPVKVVWNRKDEIATSGYHALQEEEHTVSLGENGKILGWRLREYMSAQTEELQWAFPFQIYYNTQRLQEVVQVPFRLPIMAWRSVQAHPHALGLESFVDELAKYLGKDPLDYRLELLENQIEFPKSFGEKRFEVNFNSVKEILVPRAIRVYKELSRLRNQYVTSNGENTLGFAGHSFGPTFAGQMAEISLENNKLQVHKITCVVDCGLVINPQLAANQIEGSIIWGLSALYYNNITLKEGKVEQQNFHDYKVLRIDKSPEVEVIFLKNEDAPSGIGEPGVPPVAPAILNAICNATGKRIRKLPIIGIDNLELA